MNEYKRLTYWQDDKDDDGNNIRYACVDGTKYALCDVLNRLAELEDKIENGTLVELPCKVGDTAYELFIHHRPPFIKESTIEKIIINPKGLRIKLSRNTMYETSISSLGKTIFLTREEAEKALDKQRKEDENAVGQRSVEKC